MTGNRTFCICILLFALGIIGAQFSPVLLPTWLSALIGAAVLPLFAVPALRPAAWFSAGLLWALFRADLLLSEEWPTALETRDVTLTGTISGLPQRAARYLKFDLDVEKARFEDRPVAFHGRVRLRWYEMPPDAASRLRAGSRWRLTARLKQPHGYYNPGGFDYEAYFYREHVRATGYVRENDRNTRLDAAGVFSLQAFRQRLGEQLEAAMPDAGHRGLLRALTLGDRSGVSDAEWDILRATGTSHLIAISGLHVGCAAAFGALLGLWVGRLGALLPVPVAAPRIAAAGALCLALFYAALSGFEVPAQRAFVMASVFLLGLLCRRHAWTTRGLCLALLVVLVMNPASVHDPGFWLSFCAVALILGWLAGREWTPGRSRVVEGVKLQWLLSFALLPLVAAFFGVVSLVSAPANMVAVPVVMFCVVPLCLVSVAGVAAGLQGPATICLGVADTVLGGLWAVLARLGGAEYASVSLHLALWQSLIVTGGTAWVLLAKPGRRKWGLVGAVVLLVPAPQPPQPGEFRLTVLDVGQGLSAVVRTARHTLVYDAGARYPGGFSLAEAVVIPYLRSRSVGNVDALVVSHGDNDHRGGYEDLYAAFPAPRVLSSVAGELPGSEFCVDGQRWEWDGVAFEMLHPAAENPPAHNNSSCVLKITGRYGSALLTGDIEAAAEFELRRRRGPALRSDVLLVPHQGSATSSTPGFIDRVAPSRAVVSAGYLNRYGHPVPEVVARYRRRGIPFVNTAVSGAVTVEFARSGIRIKRWREAKPRYWLDRERSGA